MLELCRYCEKGVTTDRQVSLL